MITVHLLLANILFRAIDSDLSTKIHLFQCRSHIMSISKLVRSWHSPSCVGGEKLDGRAAISSTDLESQKYCNFFKPGGRRAKQRVVLKEQNVHLNRASPHCADPS